MRDLQASLRDHPMAMLRVIAELNGVELTTNLREDASAQVAGALHAPDAVPMALERCSAAARAAWQALVAAGGKMKVPAFARRYGTPRPAGPGKLERDAPWRAPANAAEELWYRGLIYRAFADLGGGPAEYFYIPEDMLPAVETTAPAADGASLAPLPTGQTPEPRQPAPPLPIDVCTLLAGLTETPLRLEPGGGWRNTDEAQLREMLLLPDPVRFSMLVTLARDLGWLAVSEAPARGARLAVRGEAIGEWLRKGPWEQSSALFAAWRDSSDWNELRRLPSLRAEGEWRNDPRLARQALLEALARLEPGAWYSIAGLVAWMKEHNPDFQRPDANYAGWYLRDQATGHYLSGFESWDQVEGRLIYFLIAEPLFWLAAVELGVEEGHREVFRLSAAGAAWICGQAPAELPAPAKLRVEEDFTITAPLAVPLIDRYRLLRFTEPAPRSARDDKGPTRHRISRRSLSRARAGGLKVIKILQFLRHATGGRVPARVETALERWEQHGGTVHITRGAVLRVEDATILATLRADPAISPLLGELLSAQAVLVSSASLPRVLAALAELGYSTRVDG